MEQRFVALFGLSQLQVQVADLFVRAGVAEAIGDYAAASSAYFKYIEAGSAYLQAAVDFNHRFPESPYGLPELVQPLVNGLMVSADIESSLGRADTAQAQREKALALSRQYLGRKGTAESKRSLAGALTLQGRFNEAITALFETRDLLLEDKDLLGLTRVAIDLADLFHWLGDYRRAKDELDHAYSIIHPLIGDRPVTTHDVLKGVIDSIGSILRGKGDSGMATRNMQLFRDFVEINYWSGMLAKALHQWDEAERCLQVALPNYRSLGVAEAIEFQLAQVKLGRGEYAAALEQCRGMAGAFEQGAFRAKRPVLQRMMAQCLHAAGESAEALRLLREAIDDLCHLHPDPDALWRAQALNARVLADTGRADAALDAFSDAVETIRLLRIAPLGYRLDSTFLTDKMTVYSDAIEQAMRGGRADTCCVFMDSLKSRTLSAVLGTGRAADDAGDALVTQFDALSRELDAIEFAGYKDRTAAPQQARQHELLEQRAALLERIRITDARWRSLSESPLLDLAAVHTALAQRSQAVLSLHYNEPVLTCVLLWQGECRAASLSLAPELPNDLSVYADNLSREHPNVFQHDLSAEFGTQASDLIPQELLSVALGAQSLVIVPHGLLHLLPWAALMHQGKRLFEYLPVGIFPNLALLAGDAAPARARSVSILGVSEYPGLAQLGDLPSVRQELADIGSLYREAGLSVHGPCLDADATAAAYRSLTRGLSEAGHLLYLSCHGTIVRQEPMNSGLLLADSKLDAAEVASSRLPFDEVVLSACSTGWRPTEVADIPLNADEILGIPGAFLEAGVRAVLVSISKAEGRSARALTTEYHRRRIAGETPLRAFQSAQRLLLASGSPPSTWAGFSLYSYV